MNPVAKIKTLKSLTRHKDKLKFIEDNRDDECFVFILKVAFDSLLATGIKFFHYESSEPPNPYMDRCSDFKSLVSYLSSKYRGEEGKKAVEAFLDKCSPIEQEVYLEATTKTLKIGVSNRKIAEVLPEHIKVLEFKKPIKMPLTKVEGFPLIVEKKLEGVRCVVIYDSGIITAITERGSSVELPTVFKAVRRFVDTFGIEDFVLEGTIYLKEMTPKEREMNYSLIRSGIVLREHESKIALSVSDFYYLHDFKDGDIKVEFSARRAMLESLFSYCTYRALHLTEAWFAHNIEEAKSILEKVKLKDGKGILLKFLEGTNGNKNDVIEIQ